MKKIILSSIVCLLLAACGGSKQTKETKIVVNMNPQFDKYKEQFIEDLWKVYPGWASSQGYHKYDSLLIVPTNDARTKELAFSKANQDSLKKFHLDGLSDNNKTDYYMIENQLKSIDWSINEQRSFEWNPSEYNVSEPFAEMLNGNYDSLDVRLRNFYLKMANIPAYYEAAKKNIKNPTVEHTQLAIEQNLGGASVFEKDLHDALDSSHLSTDEKQQVETRAAEAVKAIREYADWLKGMKNMHPRSFRLGKELYAKKFEY